MNSYPITKNSKIKRIAEKATYDTETIHQIIDEALFCHIGIYTMIDRWSFQRFTPV